MKVSKAKFRQFLEAMNWTPETVILTMTFGAKGITNVLTFKEQTSIEAHFTYEEAREIYKNKGMLQED